jgi:predicted NBD/HSP70 family sugar kinase
MGTVGIDVGGTFTRVSFLDHHGNLSPLEYFETPRGGSGSGLAMRLVEAMPRGPVESIGLALPGLLDARGEAVVRSVNLPELEGFPVRRALQEATGCNVTLMTDIDAATWGEYQALGTESEPVGSPAPRNSIQRFVHLRIGTGIGCGLIENGRLVALEPNRAGHPDLLVIDDSPNAPMCRCGKPGCLEAIASGAVLREQSATLGLGSDLKAVAEAALQRRAAQAIAAAIIRIARHFNPDVVCLGGGIIEQLPMLLDRLRSAPRDRNPLRKPIAARKPAGPFPEIIPSRLGQKAGVLGAAILARSARSTRSVDGCVGAIPGDVSCS